MNHLCGKRALITGITGQDGSYLAEFLLNKGYEVHGMVRRASNFNTQRIDHLYEDPHSDRLRLTLHYGDLADSGSLRRLIDLIHPDEVYNLGAQSHVKVSFDEPEYTADVVGTGTLRLLEAIRAFQDQMGQQVRFYQASTSEMYGSVTCEIQNETTPFHPRSPYATAKTFAHWQTVNFREAFQLHASCGILFNHESPRRGETFVTRKITRAATRIKLGLQTKLYLGNLEAVRDWGFAGDYVEAMWLMMQQEVPDDYVVATSESHSVREFAELVFSRLGLDYRDHVDIDDRYYRPAEVEYLRGDASKARLALGWSPKTPFSDLVNMMISHDMNLASQEALLVRNGHPAMVGSLWA